MWRRAGATGVVGTQMGSAAIKELEAAPEQPYLCPPRGLLGPGSGCVGSIRARRGCNPTAGGGGRNNFGSPKVSCALPALPCPSQECAAQSREGGGDNDPAV